MHDISGLDVEAIAQRVAAKAARLGYRPDADPETIRSLIRIDQRSVITPDELEMIFDAISDNGARNELAIKP